MNEDLFMMTNGQLGIIALESSKELGEKVCKHIVERRSRKSNEKSSCTLENEKHLLIPIEEIRFSNGDGKVKIEESVRGKDIYILADVGNYSCTYKMFGFENHKGPDEHFQDIKRVVSAVGGRAKRVIVIMPLLYESRQHRRKGRESLDCAIALQELERLGVEEIVTFDVHDPTIQNSIPLISFVNLYPTYEIVKKFVRKEQNLLIDKSQMIVISPDTGAMDRAVYYSNVLGLDIGLFYKRRDHSTIVHGKNPIIQHEYIGRSVEGKNVLIIDDMIASGESIFDIAVELKKRKAKNIYVAATFALFTEGIEKFDRFYSEGLINQVYSTNLTYIPQEVKEKEWFTEVDMSTYLSKVIDYLNYDKSLSSLLDSTHKINNLLKDSNL